jgi:DNA-binding NtrC family response regulator
MTDPLHVLIVDDEPRIRTMLRRYLVEEGFKVSDAGDGAGVRTVLAREVIHPGCRHSGRKQPYDRDFGALPDITG